jgi:hypothetical protein
MHLAIYLPRFSVMPPIPMTMPFFPSPTAFRTEPFLSAFLNLLSFPKRGHRCTLQYLSIPRNLQIFPSEVTAASIRIEKPRFPGGEVTESTLVPSLLAVVPSNNTSSRKQLQSPASNHIHPLPRTIIVPPFLVLIDPVVRRTNYAIL